MARGYEFAKRRKAFARIAERPASITDDEAAALWIFVGQLADGSELVRLLLATAARPVHNAIEAALVSREVADGYASSALIAVPFVERLEALVKALQIGAAVLQTAVETRADAKDVNSEASARFVRGALSALGIPMLEPEGIQP